MRRQCPTLGELPRQPDAAEAKMLAALAREAVEAAALHGSRRLTFHHFWLLAWRRPARACEIDMHIEVRWGSGKTILEAGRIDMGGK